MNVDDTELAYNRFQTLFLEEYELCFPLKTMKVKYKNRKPWLTSGLKTSIKEKNRLYIIQKKKPYLYNKVKYKNFRNKLNNILAKAERKHYDIFSSPVGSLCHTRGVVRRPSFVVRRLSYVLCRLCPP